MGSAARRELQRLELRLAIDRLQVRRARADLRASAHRAIASPTTLLAAFAAGALGTAWFGRRRRLYSERLRASQRPRSNGATARLVWAALRAGSKPALSRLLASINAIPPVEPAVRER